ncbi:hypothetical protein LTR84_005167 [Exophiala bonariae]|uniref:Hydantoinase B/oxoprolinase domain-containing protein n=1 Tax=Exophiala bonariae TaxID=1690606 RepID=A0AAV9NQQ2_9EURO|nr:hypothetical protein LTR84_005167 [Exophiala bonariae]
MNLSNPIDELRRIQSSPPGTPAQAMSTRQVYFEGRGWTEVGVYYMDMLHVGARILGPAVIADKTQTVVLDSTSEAILLSEHLILDVQDTSKQQLPDNIVDHVRLSVFGHRFMSVAEQMGQTMQKTSVSVNIKERLDFSCAVFSSDGGLVANAPHIPGHLGSMSYAIAYPARLYKPGELKPGDVLLSNHPCSGGAHLPDLTVITPVFDNESNPTEILLFVANRGHHADIGGTQPGSMPPNSTELWQEGAAIESFKLVKEGVFDEEGLIDILYEIPGSYPGCSGTRTLRDNIADLKAAISSNKRGIQLINALIQEDTWPVVKFYMDAIQNNATGKVIKGFGNYETIADPEICERRYPVLLQEFSIRANSGGGGLHHGGEGCIRDIEFRRPMQVSVLSERRVIPPYGMAGGSEGKRGVNLWIRKDPEDGTCRTISLGGKATTFMNAGDRIIVMTPGGGGYGEDPNATPCRQIVGASASATSLLAYMVQSVLREALLKEMRLRRAIDAGMLDTSSLSRTIAYDEDGRHQSTPSVSNLPLH